MEETGLVLEGGGMRGIFTIGVLDALMDAEIWFPYVVGVSAGACNGCSYVTRQRGRARFSNVVLLKQYGAEYLGIKQLLKTGNIFNTRLLYDYLPNRIWPFDYKRFFSEETEFEMVATSLRLGEPMYLSNHDNYFSLTKDPVRAQQVSMDMVLASSSLPYVSKIAYVWGIPLLDGGIVDSIPLKRAWEKGYFKNVVVLTRNKGYRKETKQGFWTKMFFAVVDKILYWDYPDFRRCLKQRSEVYNRQLDLLEYCENKGDGKTLVIRPEKPIEVSRIERDPERLQELYEEGYRIGKKYVGQIREMGRRNI